MNVAFPDTNATYWLSRFVVEPGTQLVVTGSFPKARYFSFHTYHPGGVPLDSLYDAQIRPDAGARNPYVGRTSTNGRYTIRVVYGSKPAHPAANTVYAGRTGVAGAPDPAGLLMLRVYVPTNPSSPAGGVPLPQVRLESATGQTLAAGAGCTGELPHTGAGLNRAMTTNSFPATSPSPQPKRAITWARAYGNKVEGQFGNQQNAYLTASISRNYGDLVVIHAKAPRFPNTRAGVPAYAPADVRYWSICQNSDSTRVNACAADFQAPLRNGYYTYVISDPAQRPRNADARHGVTWLPWGASDATALLIYRNMLISPSFHHAVQDVVKGSDPVKVMGAYYPRSAYCSTSIFEAGGWQACLEPQ